MSDMTDPSAEGKSGCGLLSAVFGSRSRRTPSTGALPTASVNPASERSSMSSDTPPKQTDRIVARPSPGHQKVTPPPQNQSPPSHNQNKGRKVPEQTSKNAPAQGYIQCGRKVPNGSLGILGELQSMITDHQRSKGASTLVRASSGNVMLYGNLGNLRQPCGTTTTLTSNLNHVKEEPSLANGKYPRENLAKRSNDESGQPVSLCRALSTRMDPEQLKILGNEDYKNGRFAEALALYDAAISIDPNRASYRSNKSAALTALGRLLEAVFECREAIRIEPFYQRAHNRLATLYLRLGDAENALYHYKHAGVEADPEVKVKAKNLQSCLNKCTDAKKQRDWNSLLKETVLAISGGADSAPQIFALRAEASLKLHKHEDADEALTGGPNFDVDDCTKFFGPIGNATLLVIRAQVDMAAGRFDDAVEAAQRAAHLDSNNMEANTVVKRTRAVAAARVNGNELFKSGRYSEACVAYGEGLDHDPCNSVLLCNRAACQSKLGQFDKAIEDCTYALIVHPSYMKARLRRADCYAKLKKWDVCIQDYDLLVREAPEDEVLERAMKEAQAQLKKQRGGEDVKWP